MRVLVHLVAAAALLIVAPGVTAQESLTKRDARGPVTVVATLLAREAGTPLRLRVTLDTHSVALDEIALERAVALRAPDGTDSPPTAVEQPSGGGHHRAAVLVFPPVAVAAEVRIVVRDVGGVGERIFVWPPAGAR